MDKAQAIKDLENIIEKFRNDFSIYPFIGSEYEFYLEGNVEKHNLCLAEILKTLAEKEYAVTKMEKESGANQYEIALAPVPDVLIAAERIVSLKEIISEAAQKYSIKAVFDAKPFPGKPGSALHINLSLHSADNNNLFAKKLDDPETELMCHAVAGLLETLLRNMVYFAPNNESYLRFTSENNPIIEEDSQLSAYNNAPVNVSWGGNNRTTAIRIPSSTLYSQSRHIEHRVSGSDAEPHLVILKILEGIYFGIKNKLSPPEKIFGNAFDKQYNFLSPLPKSLEEARNHNQNYDI